MTVIFQQYGEKAATEKDPFLRYCYEVLHGIGKAWDQRAWRIKCSGDVGSTSIDYIYEAIRLEQKEIDWLSAMQIYRERCK